jgi:hypothetical protein
MIDFSLTGGPILNNDIALVLQQIDILFDTIPTEVLGYEDFGTKYHKFLFDLNISNEAIKYTVLSDLQSLDLLGFEPEVEVHLLQGTEHDIALVEIDLYRDEEHYQKVYKIN